MNNEDAFHLSVIENIQREQMTAIEEAYAFYKYVELGFTHEAIAKKVSKNRDYVTSRLRLLKLIPELQDWIAQGYISDGHAKQILKIESIVNRFCGSNFINIGEKSVFEHFQQDFIKCFDGKIKITVNEVENWVSNLKEHFLYPLIAVFNGQDEVIISKTKSFDITARGKCNIWDLQIQNIVEEDIDFLLKRTLDKAEQENNNDYPRWQVYKIYDDLKSRLFENGIPDWPQKEKDYRNFIAWDYEKGKPNFEQWDSMMDTMYIFHDDEIE
jgi:hypothetical protein